MFSICLCSWNDLEYLKILIQSIQKNTRMIHEIIVHDNGSEDGTEEWLRANDILYSRTPTNEGVAAVNYAVERAKYPYIININADMHVFPNWDTEIYKQIRAFEKEGIEKFTISSCLVEPIGANPEYTVSYHGHNPETFSEASLMMDYFTTPSKYVKMNTTQYSHPITIPKALWDEFGGVDTGYQYGIGTDHDIPASAYKVGCRNFIMLGKSKVYHFISQTVKKLPQKREDGQLYFKNKWGMTVSEFRQKMGIAKPYRRVDDGIL